MIINTIKYRIQNKSALSKYILDYIFTFVGLKGVEVFNENEDLFYGNGVSCYADYLSGGN